MPALRFFRILLTFTLAALLTGLTSCANKSTRGQVKTRRIVFEFSVQGSLALNNPNVTYYVVLNSPEGQIEVANDSAAAAAATASPTPSPAADSVCPEGQEPAAAPSPDASSSPDANPEASPDASPSPEASASPTAEAGADENAADVVCVPITEATPEPTPTPTAANPGAATLVDAAGIELDPNTQGPRGNGPSINDPASSLIGRLPFTGFVQGLTLVPSVWTDFYYIHGNSSGNPVVGRGENLNGIPQKVDQNYSPALYKKLDNSTFELQILFSDIFPDSSEALLNPVAATPTSGEVTIDDLIPQNVVVNVVVGDNIDSGQGFVYDSWLNNQPFSIPVVANNSPNEQFDNNPNLNLVALPQGLRNPFNYPAGVGVSALNLTKVRYRVVEF